MEECEEEVQSIMDGGETGYAKVSSISGHLALEMLGC